MSHPQSRTMTFEPLYYADRITIINPRGDVGIVTLWTPLQTAMRMIDKISPSILDPCNGRVAVISNLYGDGMYQMLCNLLYNPQIRHLVAVGEELLAPTTAEIEAFLRYGLEQAVMLGTTINRIPGTSRIFPLLEDFDTARLQRQLTFAYLGKLAGGEAGARLPGYLDSLPRHTSHIAGERLRVEIPPALPGDYAFQPSDITAHQVTRRRPLDCWEELVTRVVRFGHPVELRSGPRLELLNTRAVITEPVVEPAEILEQYGFSLERFRKYQNMMLDPSVPPDISYTYGNRLRAYFHSGGRDIDTLDSVVKELRHNPESRHAFVSLWDTSADLHAAERDDASVPCLVTVFFRRSEGRLTLTATYRSHNLLSAWLQNVYGLMKIQEEVCQRTGMAPGPLTVISHSLGIDPRSPQYGVARGIAARWTRDEDLDRSTGKHSLREDPNGYFIVTVDEAAGELVAEHRYEGLLVKQYRADRAAKIEREIIGDMAVSLVSHALWLGRELATKELVLRQGRRGQAGGAAGEAPAP